MISISQDKKTFYYIHWVPSESGPLILTYGKETLKANTDSNQVFYDILDTIRIKTNNVSSIYSMTIDSNMVSFSETQVDKSFDHFDVIDWFHKKTIGNIQDGIDETFHYSFSVEDPHQQNLNHHPT